MKTSTAIVVRDPGAPEPPPGPRIDPKIKAAFKTAIRKTGGQAFGNIADEFVKDLTKDPESDGLGSVGVSLLSKILGLVCPPGSEGAALFDTMSEGAMANAAAKFAASMKQEEPDLLVLCAQEKLGVGPFAKKNAPRSTPEKRSRRHNRRRRYR